MYVLADNLHDDYGDNAPPECREPDEFPCCECANKCDGCNEHLTDTDMEFTMAYSREILYGKCIQGEG